jgi:hypothetical protein
VCYDDLAHELCRFENCSYRDFEHWVEDTDGILPISHPPFPLITTNSPLSSIETLYVKVEADNLMQIFGTMNIAAAIFS